MSHYEVQIAPCFNSYFEDDRYGDGTIYDKFVSLVSHYNGEIVKMYPNTAILKFNKDEDAIEFNKVLKDWLAPRMFNIPISKYYSICEAA